MSIVIKGMDMPKGNSTKNLLIYSDGRVFTGYKDDENYFAEELSEGIKYVELSEEDYEKMAEQMRKTPIVLTFSEPEIIRCKDCKHYRECEIFGRKITLCKRREYDSLSVEPDDFCSRAERRTDG